jgi:hypothetical protein
MQRSAKSLADRFWVHVNRHGPDECWEWQAATERSGYGRLSGGRRGEKQILAHRFSYQLHNGPIPDGLLVCHSCDNRKCCNPAHLWLGTCAENHADRNRKDRQAKGETQGSAKLVASDVVAIRQMKAMGLTLGEIAAMFSLSKNHVSRLVQKQNWRHVA